MPTLDNPKHEMFAQEIAKGTAIGEAYVLAGYEGENTSAAAASASRLLKSAKIQARVSELLNQGATRAIVSIQKVLEKLDRAYDLAEKLDQPAVMVSASMGLAKVAGLIVNKQEVGAPGDFDGMNAEQVREWIRERASASGFSLQAARGSGREGAARGKPH